jgi:uncharacterized protein with von Willebrand factor type A (vWA) domain
MTTDEREKMNQLCILIQSENDRAKITALVKDLNDLLARKEHRFGVNESEDPLL